MSEIKRTPGPWVFEDYSQEEPEFFVVPGTYFGTVAKVFNEADARLIAAAPELLEALKRALKTHGDQNGWAADAQAAIAKADGERT